MTPEVRGVYLEEFINAGKGPIYMDGRGISDKDYDYMMHWMWHEGNAPLLDYMKEEKIDFRKHPIEFHTYHIISEGKIGINERAETSIPGLFSAGDESMGGISCAATYGWISGEQAADYSRKHPLDDRKELKIDIDEKSEFIKNICERKEGADWREVNIALQQLMKDYAGMIRSEAMLNAGLTYLRRMRKNADRALVARNRWELSRCIETKNLMELGELVFISAIARKESRALHQRSDYPLTDPVMDNKEIIVRQENGKVRVEVKSA
jgi:succinate dehydrogenase/fumarate reductase flavoprotein subunit